MSGWFGSLASRSSYRGGRQASGLVGEESTMSAGQWQQRPSSREALSDHEHNPEYEVHLGQVTQDGRRRVSVWLQGQRWSGWLEAEDTSP
jgi:hypothetical protein